MTDISPMGARFEYWFFNFRADGLNILGLHRSASDDRRRREIRVSRWVRGIGTVERSIDPLRPDRAAVIGSAAGWFRRDGSVGSVGASSWELRWTLGSSRFSSHPGVFGPLHPTDLDLVAFPEAQFDGWVAIAGERFEVVGRPGAITHYGGRRLPDRWIWISATEFPDEPGRRVEASAIWTRTWGRGPSLPVGYLWTTDGRRADLTISPVSGLIRVSQDRRLESADLSISMSSRRLDGRSHQLHAAAPARAFNDLGDGIRQTLLADLTFDGLAAAPSSVGLEQRIS